MSSVFVSHWSRESKVAILLKEWIENIFDDTSVFVSSSSRDIEYGREWEESMMEALKRASVTIVLVSKNSYDRKWIHIETGFSLAREVKLLIVRIDDFPPELMGRPYDNYQSLSISSDNFVKIFMEVVSDMLNQELRGDIGYDYMALEMREVVKEVLR
jgi:hypothetical protein